MDRKKFDEFIKYILTANRTNHCVIEIFQSLNALKEELITELIHLKPNIDKYKYDAHLDSLLHDLNKLDFSKNIDHAIIDSWLDKHNTTKEGFLQWHTENPNVSIWKSDEPPNNILFEILYTHLALLTNWEQPNQQNYPRLNNYTYQELQSIQHEFERVIKNIVTSQLVDFIMIQKKKMLQSQSGFFLNKYAWFNVGILFANGEIRTLKEQFNGNVSEFARYKFNDEWEKHRPYISQSIAESNKGNKNIFKDINKLKSIQKYCVDNDIDIVNEFLLKINQFKLN